MVLMCPQNSGVANVVVLKDGVSKRWLGHEGSSLTNGMKALIKEASGSFQFSCPSAFCYERTQRSFPLEGAAIRVILEAEDSPHQTTEPAVLRTSSLQNCEKVHFCSL